jgi:RNA polymerase sigma-70 factor (ECF subfamily)
MAMEAVPDIPASEPDQDALYAEAVAQFGASPARLATAYEVDRSRQQDLLQDIHVALWRRLATFKGQCSLRTWVYRIAHNSASTYVRVRVRMRRITAVSLEELDEEISQPDSERVVDLAVILEKLRALIQRLKPIDQSVPTLSGRSGCRRNCRDCRYLTRQRRPEDLPREELPATTVSDRRSS